MKATRILGILFVAILAVSAPAFAVPQLRLSDGVSTVTITDGGVGDANGTPGAVTWIGSIGSFVVNVSTGVSKPVFPDANMDLNSINIAGGAGGTLLIEFTDTDFQTLLGFAELFGGTLLGPDGSSVLAEGWFDQGNAAFGQSSPICAIGPFGPGAFGGSCSNFGAPGAPNYSLTQRITLRLTGAGDFSGDFRLRPVPEPATMFLLGSGIIAGLRRRRKNAAQ
jgi:hypothetical protein